MPTKPKTQKEKGVADKRKVKPTKPVLQYWTSDISCEHGSRWIWWQEKIFNPEGAWMQVVFAPGCECSEPPRPTKEMKS